MASNSGIRMPGGWGGITRFDEEYQSKFMLSPGAVIGFIVGVIILVVGMKMILAPAA